MKQAYELLGMPYTLTNLSTPALKLEKTINERAEHLFPGTVVKTKLMYSI